VRIGVCTPFGRAAIKPPLISTSSVLTTVTMGILGSLAVEWFQVTISALKMVWRWLLKSLEWLRCKKEFPQKITMMDYKVIIKFTMGSQFLIMKLSLKSLSQILKIQWISFPCPWMAHEIFHCWTIRVLSFNMGYIVWVMYYVFQIVYFALWIIHYVL
jgi:hypothetical protein